MIDDKQVYILRTSSDVINKLSINSNNSLTLEEIKSGEVIGKSNIIANIKNYSAAIDKEDKIHIAYTDDNMNLKYMVLLQKNKIINITAVKYKLSLGCISIKILDLKPHIIFSVIDVKQNIHIINHSYFVEEYWITKEIFESVASKYIQPYSLELYNNEIYIMLYLRHVEGKAALFKFEDLSNEWIDIDSNIQIEGSSNVNFFISPSNVAIITYNKLINKSIQIIVMYRNLEERVHESWISFAISDNDTNTLKPSIFFNKECYYITWIQGDKIVLKRSKELIIWEDVLIFDKHFDKYLKCHYMSNNSMDSELKINSIYFSNTRESIPAINSKGEIRKEYIALDSGQSNISYLEDKLQFLHDELEKRTYEKIIMENNINNLQDKIEKYEEYINIIDNLETSSIQDININIINFLNEIIDLKKENEILLNLYKNNFLKMYDIIQDKNRLIDKLLTSK